MKAGDTVWNSFYSSVRLKTIEAQVGMTGPAGLSVELCEAPGLVRAFVDPWDEQSAAWVRGYMGDRLPMGTAIEVRPAEMKEVLEVHDS